MPKFDYTSKGIVQALKKVGLRKGMDVFIHSNLPFFGKPNFEFNLKNIDNFFLKQIKNIIGKNGNIVVPAFTYSYCNNQIYDPKKVNKKMGKFSEVVQLDKNSKRSNDPIFSVSVIGNKANYYTDFKDNNCFGKKSFWSKFLKNNGYILGLNFGIACTIFHHFEWLVQAPYRFEKKFTGTTKIKNKKIVTDSIFFCRDLNNNHSLGNFIPIERDSLKHKIKKISFLGKGYISLSSSKKAFKLFKKKYELNKYYLTVKNH